MLRTGRASFPGASSSGSPSPARWPAPGLLIADEPTSQLDLETGRQIMELLLSVVRSEGITALVATHDEALIDLADSVIVLQDGHVVTRQAAGPQALAGDAGTQARDE